VYNIGNKFDGGIATVRIIDVKNVPEKNFKMFKNVKNVARIKNVQKH